MNLLFFILLTTSLTLNADQAAASRLERLKKRMAKKDANPDAKKDDSKPAAKPKEPTAEPVKTEDKKPDEKPSEPAKVETPPSEEKKLEEPKSEEKKDEPKASEAKASEEAKPTATTISSEGKVDLAKVISEDSGATDRDWSENIALREKIEEQGNEILKKTQSESTKTNEHLEKINKIHSETASTINQTYQEYSQPISTYIQMNEEVAKYLKTISDDKDSNVKDLAKDLEKASKEIIESIEKLKKAIEDIDKLEKDNEENFTKSQEQSVLVLKKLGEVQLAYNDISRTKTTTEAKELITKMEAAVKECSDANKALQDNADKTKSLSKEVEEKSAAVKSASQDTQNLSEKITGLMSKIEKTKLEKSSKAESTVVKNLKKMSEFVQKKKAYAQEKPTTFGMALLNFFVNVGNGVKDFFVRLFVISTNQKSHIKTNESKDEPAQEPKKETSEPKVKEADKKEESSKEPAKTDPSDKNDSEPTKDAAPIEDSEKKRETTSYDKLKSSLEQFFQSSKALASSLWQYASDAYAGFVNKKKPMASKDTEPFAAKP